MSDISSDSSPDNLNPEPRLFRPSAAALNWVITIGFAAFSYAAYLRYGVIEQPQLGLACEAGLGTWKCLSRAVAVACSGHDVFGWISLGAAVLAFVRPTLPLFTIGLAASASGVVLYNAGLSSLAAALLILCFARPVVDPDPAVDQA
jgi:hypothetical protein